MTAVNFAKNGKTSAGGSGFFSRNAGPRRGGTAGKNGYREFHEKKKRTF